MGSGFTVRDATKADLARVTEIKVRNWAETYGALLEPAILAPFLDRRAALQELGEKFSEAGTLLLVAQDGGGEVVGFALTFVDREPEPWLESLHVLSDFRGEGVGSLLMRATAGHLVERGHVAMRLGVISGNEKAARFYERLGGEVVDLEPVEWAPGAVHEVYRWADVRSLR